MLFTIRHEIVYRYSSAAFFEPTVVRLRPHSNAAQRLIEYQLTVEPAEAGRAQRIDLDGNDTVLLWFDGTHTSLRLDMHARVETFRNNPFEFILASEGAPHVPMRYAPQHEAALALYRGDPADIDRDVAAFAREAVADSSGDPVASLLALTQAVHAQCTTVVRELGEPRGAEDTLARGDGACRDLAVLFIDAARSLGFAARFVSGYQETAPDTDEPEMHAWAGVYLPGGGWRGFDPSIGLAVRDRHVSVAAGSTPGMAAPVAGTFRSDDATAALEYRVAVSTG